MLSRAILQLLPKRARLSGRVMFDGRDLAGLPPEALRRLRGPRARRGLPGPDDLAQSGAHHRHPDHRDAAGASRHGRRRRRGGAAPSCWRRSASRRRSSGCGNIRTSSPAACASGWRSPSRWLRAQAADRRRADHGARRHGAGADPRPAGARAAAPPHGDDPDHPRSRRRRRPHRRGGGDVCRPGRRARADADAVRRDAHALHRGAAGGDPQARTRRRTRRCRRSPAGRPIRRGRCPAARSRRAAATPTERCREAKPPLRPIRSTPARSTPAGIAGHVRGRRRA